MCIYNFENKNNKNEKKGNRDTFYCERELSVEECFFFGFLSFTHLSSSLSLSPFLSLVEETCMDLFTLEGERVGRGRG